MSDIPPLDARAYKVLADVLGGDGKVVAFRPLFAHALGGACNALLLSQFWYWTNMPTVQGRADGWFWKSQKDITLETGLTRTETETARRKLTEIGVVVQEVRGVPATVHFRINKDVLFELLWRYILANPVQFAENLQTEEKDVQNPQTRMRETRKLVRGKPANKSAENLQTIQKTTQEKTQKTTQEIPSSEVFASLLSEEEGKEPTARPWADLPEPERAPWLDKAEAELKENFGGALWAKTKEKARASIGNQRAANLYLEANDG